ncbi:amiloride-sensitive sodium channel subunit beta-2-like [Ptychodera flava]|uniref:amiloride-sensitive sodium channel subunit beta-2-like n=1 Tax=Ptychodera flava TaxID=63121 RepID=UPI00396A9151
MLYRCDEQAHCGSDEDDCENNICPFKFFTCADGQCVLLNNRCDFGVHCSDGSDEVNCSLSDCPNEYFRCRSGQCVVLQMRCNFQVDCVDGSDEYNCTGLEPPPANCDSDEFKCVSLEKCVNASWVCNGVDDCGDNSDESECTSIANCKIDEFLCQGGDETGDFCIPRLWLCDRINQCGDGSDELNCTYGVENVFSDPKWKLFYHDITVDDNMYKDFISNVYINRNFDFVRSENPPSWNQFLLASSTPDFTDLQDVLKLTPEELSRLGHQAEDLVLQCTYDQKNCNYSEFYAFQHDKYGNCFTFNHGMNNDTVRKASKAGADYGLKLTLFTEQNEYIGLFGQQSGVRVVIHHQMTKPFPEDDGVGVKPGAVTSIAIKMNKRMRIGYPHGNCSDGYQNEEPAYQYSVLACQKLCLQSYLLKKCGCVDSLTSDKPRCSVLNKTQDACKQIMNYFYQAGLLVCDCQQSCSEVTFSKAISQALWPSAPFLPHLLNSIHASNRKTWVIHDKESAREDLVRLEVYFEDLSYNFISEEKAYSITQLLSDTGGSLGLYVGLSVITLIEFIEYLVLMFGAMRRRRKVTPKPNTTQVKVIRVKSNE